MSRKRRVITGLVFIAVCVAFVLSFTVLDDHTKSARIQSYVEVPWLKATLCAFAFGTMLVPLGLADIHEPVKKTLKIWALFLMLAMIAWHGPLLLAPRFQWSLENCFSASLVLMLIPTFLEPFGILSDWHTKGRKKQIYEAASQ